MGPEWLDWVVHLVSSTAAVAAVTAAWRLLQRMNRDESLKQDYPPHRHINGKILYPHDYEPAVVERLHGAD